MNREQYLARSLPKDWTPKYKEHVVIPLVHGTLAANVMTGTIHLVAPPYLKVLIRAGSQHRILTFRIDQVRPIRGREARMRGLAE